MIDDTVMSFEEKSTYLLRSLYKKYGYLPYKMSKFEEYELYIRNKDFLLSDRVIAFNDTNGKLMALKPDVTLSIIKNGEDIPGVKQKVFYNENVYRVSESTGRFKEIMQTGLECIGDIDIYDICEEVALAAESLSILTDRFVIEVSNLSLVNAIISSVCSDAEFGKEAVRFVSEKNSHDLKKLCADFGVEEQGYQKIAGLITIYGDRRTVIDALTGMSDLPEVREMALLSELLDSSPFGDRIRFDFSIVNDMNYYNGFVFRGFVDGVSVGVLSGGQYDNMMKKMNRHSGAVGFAIYLDRMEALSRSADLYDVDCLVLYDDRTDPKLLPDTARRLIAEGSSVSLQKSIPGKLRYKRILDLREGATEC